MSWDAVKWAFGQDVRPATNKIVLVALANFASEQNYTFPSSETVEKLTSLDRKTVLSSIQNLVECGYIVDTGERIGRTNQIRVFRLNGIAEDCDTHYVYKVRLDETGEFYIGLRSCYGDPSTDCYTGSGVWTHQVRKAGKHLSKEVLKVFGTREEARLFEISTISQHKSDPLCRNLQDLPRPSSKHPKNGTVIGESIPNMGSLNDTGKGTVNGESIPFFPPKHPVFPAEASQKRDTEPRIKPIEEPFAPKARSAKEKKAKEETNPEHHKFVELWCDCYQAQFGKPYGFDGMEAKAVSALLAKTRLPAAAIMKVVTRAWASSGFNCSNAKELWWVVKHWNAIQCEVSETATGSPKRPPSKFQEPPKKDPLKMTDAELLAEV